MCVYSLEQKKTSEKCEPFFFIIATNFNETLMKF